MNHIVVLIRGGVNFRRRAAMRVGNRSCTQTIHAWNVLEFKERSLYVFIARVLLIYDRKSRNEFWTIFQLPD